MTRVLHTGMPCVGILLLAGLVLSGGAGAQEPQAAQVQPAPQVQPAEARQRPLPRGTPRLSAASPVPQGVYYADCEAAIAAGATPLYRGQAGYRDQLDRDGDGIACEPYRQQALNTRR